MKVTSRDVRYQQKCSVKIKNKGKLVKTILPHLSIIYFITQGRGAQIFVCYVRPEVNMKKGLGEGNGRGKGSFAIY